MIEFNMPDLCKCGHPEHSHLWGECWGCHNRHEFVIDNLQLIENLAKERNLV
jgi:hypothetical protein